MPIYYASGRWIAGLCAANCALYPVLCRTSTPTPTPTGLRELYAKGPKQSFFLVKFWADLHYDYSMTTQGFFGIDSSYVSTEGMSIECSTSVISLGKQVVEKIQTDQPKLENGRFVYRFQNSPMCPYMISFIEKLRNLTDPELMNRVLENFSVVQVGAAL